MRDFIALAVLLGLSLTALAQDPPRVQVDQSKIDGVKAGTITEAHATWWGYDKEDATKAIQAAIDSGVKKVVIDNVGSDWVVAPIQLRSNLEIVLNDGVVLRRKPGAFVYQDSRGRLRGRILFQMTDLQNVTFRGIGSAKIVGEELPYGIAIQASTHTFNIEGSYQNDPAKKTNSKNISIVNLTVCPSGGDVVRICGCEQILLDRLQAIRGYRQGISITGDCIDLKAVNCKFNDTAGSAPMAGIDIEPNYDSARLENLVFEDCEFVNNELSGVCVSNNSNMAASITFQNCLIEANANGGIMMGHTSRDETDRPGKIEFIKCRIVGHKVPAVTLAYHPSTKTRVVLRDCLIDNSVGSHNAVTLSSDTPKDLYGIEIVGLTVVENDIARDPVVFNSRYGNSLVNPIVKDVAVKTATGETRPFDAAKFIRDSAPNPEAKAFKLKLMDKRTFTAVAKKGQWAGAGIRFRNTTDYYVNARVGDRIPIKFTNRIVHAFDDKPLEIIVSTPTVPNVQRLKLPFKQSLEYTLEAKEDGNYKFEIQARGQTVTVECAAPGQALSSSEKLYVFGCSGRLYFAVPPGTKKVVVEAGGSLREESDCALLDPSGTIVAEAKRLAGSKLLSAERVDAAKPEVWSVEFNASKLFLRLGDPIPFLFSTSPTNVMRERAF